MQEPDNHDADIIYIYKGGPEFPDPELSGEEQIRQQQAYLDTFASFEKDPSTSQVTDSEEEGQEEGDDDDLSDVADNQSWMDHDFAQEEDSTPTPPAGPSDFMVEILKTERGARVWQQIQEDLAAFLSKSRAFSRNDSVVATRLRTQEESMSLPPAVPEGEPSDLDFPQYWHIVTSQIQSDQSPELRYIQVVEGYLRPAFREHTTYIRTAMQKISTMAGRPYYYDSECDAEEPTPEDEDNFLDWLGTTKMLLKASLLVMQINNAFLEYGEPNLSELSRARGVILSSLSRLSLESLVRIFDNARAKADPAIEELLKKEPESSTEEEIKAKDKQRLEMVQHIISQRKAVREARRVSVQGSGLCIEPAKPEEMGQRSPRIVQHGFEFVNGNDALELANGNDPDTLDVGDSIIAGSARSVRVALLNDAFGTDGSGLTDTRETPATDESVEDYIERVNGRRNREVLSMMPAIISKKKSKKGRKFDAFRA